MSQRRAFYHMLFNPITDVQRKFASESLAGKHGSFKNNDLETKRIVSENTQSSKLVPLSTNIFDEV